ncbi:hypothetical protein HanIR_Chr07g0301051 [Helianthus annuus]|nr:hypothetical protein HanIR_Chr07g0301051 [Helianthus annuus]
MVGKTMLGLKPYALDKDWCSVRGLIANPGYRVIHVAPIEMNDIVDENTRVDAYSRKSLVL